MNLTRYDIGGLIWTQISNASADSCLRPSSWQPLCPLQLSCLRCQSSGRPSATCWAPWCCASTWTWTKPALVTTNPTKKSLSSLKSAECGSPPSCVSCRRWTGPAGGRPPLGGGVVDGPAHHHRLPGSHLHPLLLLPSLHAGKKQRKSVWSSGFRATDWTPQVLYWHLLALCQHCS